MPAVTAIVPCLWFDKNAEEAAKFYCSVFPNSRITNVSYHTGAGQEHHGGKPGDVLLVEFSLDGTIFTALNGGPHFKFNEAVSFQVMCDTQEQVDFYHGKLSAVPEAEQCSWLKDKYGLSWQIFPTPMKAMLLDKDRAKAGRAMTAMMGMKKLDIAALEKAFEGK